MNLGLISTKTQTKPILMLCIPSSEGPIPRPMKMMGSFLLIFIENGLADPQNVSGYQFLSYFQIKPLNVKLIFSRTLFSCIVLKLDHSQKY